MEKKKEKTALVFGGSRGIGAASVLRLVKDGFAVAFTYVAQPEKAERLVNEITKGGGIALAVEADSSNAEAIKAAVDKVVTSFGKLDAVVVNAGVFKTGLVSDFSVEDLDQMLSINVRGVFLSVQAVAPHVKDGGRIITIGSNTAIRTGFAGTSAYQGSKAAVAAFVKGFAMDFAPRKITVNNIQPGPTKTDMHSPEAVKAMSEGQPLKRIGEPEEIAGLVSYLAGEESGYMTGSSLTIDGGYVL